MKVSKKALSLVLSIALVFSVTPNSLVYAADNKSLSNSYQDSSYDSGVAVNSIELNTTNITLENGQSEILTYTIKPTNATDQKVYWATSNSAVCAVDQNGKITGLKDGSAIITVITEDGALTATCNVNVDTSVKGITIDKKNITLTKGSKETLAASVIPSNAPAPQFTWSSSDNSICTVDSTGHVTALNTGTAAISATTKDGGYTATCIVTVIAPIASVTLNKTTLTLNNGKSEILTATITPTDATNKGVFWASSNSAVCTVNQDGKVSAVNNGSAVITVTTYDGGFTATCNVNVITPVTGITLNKSKTTIAKGSQEVLIATVLPTGASEQGVYWFSTDSNICTVDSNGTISALNEGSAIICATTKNGGFTAACSVTVVIPSTGITLNKSELTLENGGSETLTANIIPADATNQEVSWSSSDNTVCSVDQNGKVTALGDGSAVITVTTADGCYTAKCKISVVTSVTGITLDQTSMTLAKGSKDTLVATVTPANASHKDVVWTSSDQNICTVDSEGNITALNAGSTIITVTTADGKYSAKCSVTVTIPASGIALSKSDLTLKKGSTDILTATVTPVDATNQKTIWATSNRAVCTVDQSGKVTAVGNGTAIITVIMLDGGYTAKCNVTVFTPVSGITLNKTELALKKGSQTTLLATVTPEDASQKAITWSSSDENICTVDSNGNLSAVQAGTAVITATTKDGNFTAKCTVTVIPIVTGISLNKTEVTMVKGSNDTLSATVTPNDAPDKSVQWNSSNKSVCTVDQSGKITALNTGNATITATTKDGGFTASCKITVVIPVTGITLDKTNISLFKGGSQTLNATITPTDATDKSVTWSSSNPSVASVDNLGNVTAAGNGTAIITATSQGGGFSASCIITVQSVPSAPQNLSATMIDDTQTSITWNAPVASGSSPITQYKVVVNGTPYTINAGSDTSKIISCPTNTSSLSVLVSAINASGESQAALVSYNITSSTYEKKEIKPVYNYVFVWMDNDGTKHQADEVQVGGQEPQEGPCGSNGYITTEWIEAVRYGGTQVVTTPTTKYILTKV